MPAIVGHHRAPSRALGATLPLAAGAVAAYAGIQMATRGPIAPGPQLVLFGVFLAAVAWMATTRRTMWALAALLVYMALIDGLVKLKSTDELPTLGRDVLLYAIVGGLAIRAMRRGERFVLPAFGGWALAWIALTLVQLAHPLNGTTLHSLASLRQHIEFVPLLFVGYFLFREQRLVRNFLAVLLAMAAINGLVGVYQSGLSPDELSGWGPGYAALLDPETSGAPRTTLGADGELHVRPPGLGSDMGFAGILGATALPGAIALILLLRTRSTLVRGAVVVATMCAAAGVLTSQSRASVIASLVALVAFVGLLAAGGYLRRSMLAVVVISVTAYLSVLAIGAFDKDTFFRYSSITPDKVVNTTVESRSGTWSQLAVYAEKIPFGAGIGSVGPAAGQFDSRPVRYNAESQFNFLVVEMGIAGLVLFLAFQVALFRALIRGMRRLRDPRTVILLAAVGAPLFAFAANWAVGVNTVSTPNAPYLWFATGLIAWWLVELPRRQEREPDGAAG